MQRPNDSNLVTPSFSPVQPICKVGGRWQLDLEPTDIGWRVPSGATNLCLWAAEMRDPATRAATVITIETGIVLTPFKQARDWLAERGEHGRFIVADKPLLTVTYRPDHATNYLTISKYTLNSIDNGIVTISDEQIATGTFQQVGDGFPEYRQAALVARQKSQCPFCRKVHFARTTKSDRCPNS